MSIDIYVLRKEFDVGEDAGSGESEELGRGLSEVRSALELGVYISNEMMRSSDCMSNIDRSTVRSCNLLGE